MLVPFLIMLREGIEAALIVAIVAGYLAQSGRSRLMPAVWVGVFLGVALSLFVGTGLLLTAAEFPQRQQEFFEGIVSIIAVVLLTSMVFWMRQASRHIKGDLQAGVEKAIGRGDGRGWALIGMVFLAVAREGLESVFFLLAIFEQSRGAQAPLGALAGMAVAVALGYGIYKGAVELNLRRFFRLTGLFILLVASGLAAGSLRKFHEAGLWNHLQQVVFDISSVLPVDSPLGSVLSGVLGYQDAPVLGEVIVYLAFLVISVWAFLYQPATAPGQSVSRA